MSALNYWNLAIEKNYVEAVFYPTKPLFQTLGLI